MDGRLKAKGIQNRDSIYKFIVEYITENGYPPTLREIGEAVGIKSTERVSEYLKRLELLGYIEVKPFSNRTIKVIGYEFRKVEVNRK